LETDAAPLALLRMTRSLDMVVPFTVRAVARRCVDTQIGDAYLQYEWPFFQFHYA
jgi:hypothetical protein